MQCCRIYIAQFLINLVFLLKKNRVMQISHSDIPKQNNLMLDFLYDFQNVEAFYRNNFRDNNNLAERFELLSTRNLPHRQKLVEIIKEKYSKKDASQLTKKNINSLLSTKTLAVVTAQQIGLLGGPLSYFYKIITAIKLSAQLNENYPEYNFVPFFWLESEDHKFENIESIHTFSKESNITKINYQHGFGENDRIGHLGDLNITNEIFSLYRQIKQNFGDFEHFSDFDNLIKSSFSENSTFGEAFFNLLFRIFDKYGLIIFNPDSKSIKLLLKPIFIEAIENYETLSVLAIQRSAKLEKSYHVQVKIHPINVFYLNENQRLRLEPYEEFIRIGNKRKNYIKTEIKDLINSQPEKFSADVVLRPILQDSILPTAIYVAGKNEINYYPQVLPFYDYFGLPSPLLFPRLSITLTEKFLSKKIDHYNLNKFNLFHLSEEELLTQMTNSTGISEVENIFEKTKIEINYNLDRLSEELFSIDILLKNENDEIRSGINQLLQILLNDVLKKRNSKSESVVRHSKIIHNYFQPNEHLQEEIIGLPYFYSKYGEYLFERLFSETKITLFEHQIIEF